MPLADWVSRRNNAGADQLTPKKRFTVQEAQASKFQPDASFARNSYLGRPHERTLSGAQDERTNAGISGTDGHQNYRQLANDIDENIDNAATFDPVNAFMQSQLAAMTQQQRNAAGLGHLSVMGLLARPPPSLRSYPSTTSGRVEELDQELSTQPSEPPSPTATQSTRLPYAYGVDQQPPARNRPPTLEAKDHSAYHKHELDPAYHSALELRKQPPSNAITGTKRKSSTGSNLVPATNREISSTFQNTSSTDVLPTSKPPSLRMEGSATAAAGSLDNPNLIYKPQHLENVELDYEPQALFRMEFEDLTQEPFDQDNNEFSMADQLEAAFKGTPEDQRHFFDSLSLKEWEEAGVWFTEKFRELTENLRQSRQQRRQLAKGFEEEVSRRHEAVVASTKKVDDKLKDMGQQGALVLASAGTQTK